MTETLSTAASKLGLLPAKLQVKKRKKNGLFGCSKINGVHG
jgi:hypothetical protein